MKEYTYVTLRQKPELKEEAATWFHDKWEVPQEAYLECMEAYLNNETEYGWYLCLDSGRIVGGLGVIENDFHDSNEETQEWLDRQISRYRKWGFGLWAVILKETDEMIGQCGLTMQPWRNEEVLEIGYLFNRMYWHRGYALEAAEACKEYAFEVLKAEEVCSIIRDTNRSSQKVAVRNGMSVKDSWIKHYRGVDMPHNRYVAVHC